MSKLKRYVSVLILVSVLLALSLMFTSCNDEGERNDNGGKTVLYVYNWGEYISDGSEGSLNTNKEFEKYCKETLGLDVTVNYSTFSSNEDLYAKISSGAVAYDVIIPSDYMIERLITENYLTPLDLTKIPNYEYIDANFKGDNVYYECSKEETYSIPYFYGMVGVIYNTAIVPEDEADIGSWDLMWNENYKGDILQFNNSRDAFGTAMFKLGFDVNEATEEEWRIALDLLKTQKSVVQGYVMDEMFNKMKSGSAAVTAYYAGDFLSMYEGNDDLDFFYPKEGTNSYIDAMCIPSNSKNVDLAHEYINFMCSEEIGVANAEQTYYATPLTHVRENEEYIECMNEVNDKAMDILYGEENDNIRTQSYLNLSPERLELINELWEELKVESSIDVSIYIGCGIIISAIIAFAAFLIIRKRKWARLYD